MNKNIDHLEVLIKIFDLDRESADKQKKINKELLPDQIIGAALKITDFVNLITIRSRKTSKNIINNITRFDK